MTEAKKEKTRQRLTMTAMYKAICDLHVAVLPEEQKSRQAIPMLMHTVVKSSDGQNVYVAGLFTKTPEEPSNAKDLIVQAQHTDGIEEATAVLLEKMRERFEEHRKKLLGCFDSVLERHHGALRGARSKIREKRS